MASGSSLNRAPSRLSQLPIKDLLAEASRMNVSLDGLTQREDIVWKLEEAIEQQYDAPSETVGTWLKPQMKGYLLKDAVQSRSNTKKRYFVLMGNFLMYYENEKESVFHPKGVWCLDDCRVGMMKRPGLGEKQACLLRGKRELVVTADSLDDLKAWNKAVQQARKYTPSRFAELERTGQAQIANMQRQIDATAVELELTRSKLREERQNVARVQLELEAAREGTATTEQTAREVRQHAEELKAAMDAEYAARDESMKAALAKEASRADAALEQLETERRQRASSNARRDQAAEDAARLKAQIDELRGQLHKEVEARKAADILKEAAIKAQLEMAESSKDMQGQIDATRQQARDAAAELARLQAQAQSDPGSLSDEAHDAMVNARKKSVAAQDAADDAEARLSEETEVAGKSGSQILAELPAEMRRCNNALRMLCLKLKKIERPEATLLYADVMSSRAKLVHARGQWANDHLAGVGGRASVNVD